MWSIVVVLLLLATRGVTQIFEGSGGDSGDTIGERFVASSQDDIIISDSRRTCVRKEFRGNGFRMKGIVYPHMFICPNGLIRFKDDTYQNWPFSYRGFESQGQDPSLAPYWCRIDLSAFDSSESRVRFASYHTDTDASEGVFNQVNSDIREFTGNNGFTATWASVVTYEDIRPHNRAQNNYEGKNTFQVVFVSSETSWYLMYNYADIDWAVGVPRANYPEYVNAGGHPVTGWNAGEIGFDYRNGEEYDNLPASGTVNAEDIDDFEGNFKRGRWIFAISPSATKSPRVQCFEWFSTASTLPARRILQCPTNRGQAIVDRRFRRKISFGTVCYERIFPRGGTGLRCCYNTDSTGELLVNPPSPGGILSRNPVFFSVAEDDDAYENCCIGSDLCTAYLAKRPKQNGDRYRPPRTAFGFGDPHYQNLDNMEYTFNGCGDYMFVISTDYTFQVQVTFSQVMGVGLGTVISALLVKLEGSVPVQINHNHNGSPSLLLHVNGTEFGEAAYENLIVDPFFIEGGIIIQRQGDSIIIITENDHTIVVTREPNNLVIVLSLDESLFGRTTGLLGNWSNTIEDDFRLQNGTLLPSNITDEQIHFVFGESWKLAPEENLIINTTADVNFNCPSNYSPIFINSFTFSDNTSLESAARDICGDDINCRFDIAATQDPSFGATTLNSSTRIENDIEMAENNAPTFAMVNVVFNLTVGELFEHTISAIDRDGDALKFTTINKPPGANVVQNGSNITFSWVVDSIEAFNLSFLVQDSKNASSALIPVVIVCACENNGSCFKEEISVELNELVFTRHEVLSCECTVGFTGEFCSDERNFCEVQSGSPCHPLSNCTNSPTDYICGGCPSGYSGNGVDCSDIDECSVDRGGCELECVNNAGSFVCECFDGYRLNDDMKNCDDINECLTGHDCQQICVNTEGSFNCACTENFQINPNNSKTCFPIQNCPANHDCAQVCAIDRISNEQVCSCNPGYIVDPSNATNCVDLNECDGLGNLCSQLCINTPGSYVCNCLDGYVLGDDSFKCEDINECVASPSGMVVCNTSNTGETCVNLPGTFRCECNANQGLVLINGICQVPRDDEVIVVEPEDPPPATPANRNNSVQLRLAGLQKNQYQRPTDVAFRSAIAAALNSYCNVNASRTAECLLPGNGFQFSESNVFRVPNGTVEDGDDLLISFYAIFPDGIFNGTNRVTVPRSVLLNALNQRLDAIVASTEVTTTIVDVDECKEGTHRCSLFCDNTPGSFVCSCLSGQQLAADMFTCVDIDECAAQTDNCNGEGEICINLNRDFTCECNKTLDLGRINGVCQVLNGTTEPPPVPRDATAEQNESAVEFIIPDFSPEQYGRGTDTQFRRAIAAALTSYCTLNAERRAECGLSASGDFAFGEQNIHRLSSDPVQEGSDTSVSFYALYPNGLLNGTDIPVNREVLLKAIREGLDDIRDATGLDSLLLAEEPSPTEDDEGIDWPIILAIALTAALILLLGVALACMCWRAKGKGHPRALRYVYDAQRHRPRRQMNVADLDPSFDTFYSVSGGTYSGFDEDGLPVDIQTDYDGLSHPARTVSNMPTGSRGSFR